MRRDTRYKRDECREKQKEGEAVYGTDRIWKFVYTLNQFSPTYIAKTGKDSCRVDMSLPLSPLQVFIELCMLSVLLCLIKVVNRNFESKPVSPSFLFSLGEYELQNTFRQMYYWQI